MTFNDHMMAIHDAYTRETDARETRRILREKGGLEEDHKRASAEQMQAAKDRNDAWEALKRDFDGLDRPDPVAPSDDPPDDDMPDDLHWIAKVAYAANGYIICHNNTYHGQWVWEVFDDKETEEGEFEAAAACIATIFCDKVHKRGLWLLTPKEREDGDD